MSLCKQSSGEWQPLTVKTSYTKRFYDVVHPTEGFMHSWPNAGKFTNLSTGEDIPRDGSCMIRPHKCADRKCWYNAEL